MNISKLILTVAVLPLFFASISLAEGLEVETIKKQILYAGSPLHIPIAASDYSGNFKITFSASSDNSSVSPVVVERSRSLKMEVENLGEMTFALFGNRVPRLTERVEKLASAGFYDNLTFHRVIKNNFVQFGDPNGDGTGGSNYPKVQDQFHPDLQHNRAGLLSFAKTIDDTNNSQLFITQRPLRFYDFEYSISGILVKGYDVLAAINERPSGFVKINFLRPFKDFQNGVLMLKAPRGFTGTANITLTASSTSGAQSSQTFRVEVRRDSYNNRGYLRDIEPVKTSVNQKVEFELSDYFVDTEGDTSVEFCDEDYLKHIGYTLPSEKNPNIDYSVDKYTGRVTITPKNGLRGSHRLSVCHWTNQLYPGAAHIGLDVQEFELIIEDPAIQTEIYVANYHWNGKPGHVVTQRYDSSRNKLGEDHAFYYPDGILYKRAFVRWYNGLTTRYNVIYYHSNGKVYRDFNYYYNSSGQRIGKASIYYSEKGVESKRTFVSYREGIVTQVNYIYYHSHRNNGKIKRDVAVFYDANGNAIGKQVIAYNIHGVETYRGYTNY